VHDGHRRKIDYLRVSITDRCNLRCVYCMPEEGISPLPRQAILRYEEILRVVKAAIGEGISRVRLTGGEPLIRRDVEDLLRSISALEGLRDLSLTTNGLALEAMAERLKTAGLGRINVSLDSLEPKRFARITRGGRVGRVLRGLRSAEEAGLGPLKINMVPIRNFNDDEIPAFAELTRDRAVHVRFIEYMPLGGTKGFWDKDRMIPADDVKKAIEMKLGPLEPVSDRSGSGPARYFQLAGARGKIGLITPVSNHFCGSCNRLRLTADGKLKPCLFSEQEIDLMGALRHGRGSLKELIRNAIATKPKRHNLSASDRPMSRIGG